MSVIGVDPGTGGALAHYDYRDGSLEVVDMPHWFMATKGGKTRKRVDAVGLMEYFELKKLMNVELVLIEAVGGRPRQSASAAFVFGYTAGLIYMGCVSARLPIETVPPQTWKKIMNIQGKTSASPDGQGKKLADKAKKTAIIQRADELFPEHRHLWRGSKGGILLDRAEAAIMAMYAANYALGSTSKGRLSDVELELVYRNADTGA